MTFIVREPLLDAAQQLVGYELAWQSARNGELSSDDDLLELASFLASQLTHQESGWLLPDSLLFIEATPAVIASELVQSLSPRHIVFRLTAADLADEATLKTASALRQQGFGIALRDADGLAANSPLLAVASHVEATHPVDKVVQAPDAPKTIVRQIPDWQTYDACSAAGFDVLIGKLYLTPRADGVKKDLNPAQLTILQLMDMVRKNADVRALEEVLKRDATLSYKLFRYINSVGFGLGAEIQSLRHAVTMLGYTPLYRWLSLLLATASTNAHSAVLMQTAIVRGRFAELAGHGILPKNEAENLFVVGMFSLLDRLLGMPMEQVLEKIQLSESISQALLSREGVYGPFLTLAESLEPDNGDVNALSDALFLSPRQVNEAHLAALSWAGSIKL
ncbi:MAG TPA: HDOD domain-containing protein [Oxalicibacterium sp.]|nr:HDOD domain-containing protein [Oxalicibacterium sp.]